MRSTPEIARRRDFRASAAKLPSGTKVHAGVYGINEHDHIELQRHRTDTESPLAYALENRLFVAVNHAYSGFAGPRTTEDLKASRATFMAWKSPTGRCWRARIN